MEMFLKYVIFLPSQVRYPEHDLTFHSELRRLPIATRDCGTCPFAQHLIIISLLDAFIQQILMSFIC